jgi:hypothetical protein
MRASQRERGDHMRPRIIGHDLLSCVDARQSVAGKDLNTEAEESTVLGALTKQRLAKTQRTEKI